MLATFGLGRLERELAQDAVTANDVAEFLEHAQAVDVRTLAREGLPEALEDLHRRQAQRLADSPPAGFRKRPRHAAPPLATDVNGRYEAGLPTRIRTRPRVNPKFSGAVPANRV
jgi:hypothetical protein